LGAEAGSSGECLRNRLRRSEAASSKGKNGPLRTLRSGRCLPSGGKFVVFRRGEGIPCGSRRSKSEIPDQLACALPEGCTVLGTSVAGVPGPEPFDGRPGRPNVFPAQRGFGPNNIVFIGVPNNPPGTGTRTYRVMNARLGAAQLPPSIPPSVPTQAVTFFSVSGPGFPIVNPHYRSFAAHWGAEP
jgi:hypothetical protein